MTMWAWIGPQKAQQARGLLWLQLLAHKQSKDKVSSSANAQSVVLRSGWKSKQLLGAAGVPSSVAFLDALAFTAPRPA